MILTHQASHCDRIPEGGDKCPSTPPPSPTASSGQPIPPGPKKKDSTLVTITIFSVNKRSPDFHSKYDGVSLIFLYYF